MISGSPDSKSGQFFRIYLLEQRNIPVLNISQVGMALETRTPLAMGQVYAFRIRTEHFAVTLEGKVARCNLSNLAESEGGDQFALYENGVEFSLDRNKKELGLLFPIASE